MNGAFVLKGTVIMEYLKNVPLPLDAKALNDDGTFSGYASIFANVDLDREVVEHGAFKQIKKNDDGKVIVLWQHSMRDPIGVADVREDAKGLAFEASLVLDDPTARKARAHMLAKSVRGMSIGFDVVKDRIKDGVRYLEEVILWEISLVTFGANPAAGVDVAKAAQQITNIRELEDFLREAGGFSKAQAVAIASGGWKTLQDRRDSGGADDAKTLLNIFNRVSQRNPS